MISYEADPSLHTAVPEEQSLDDGFSRPRAQHDNVHGVAPDKKLPAKAPENQSLEAKSPF